MNRPITIMISNQKGGVGKTTSAIELAHILGQKNKVLCIDMDPQCDMSIYLNVSQTQYTIRNVLDGDASIEEAAVEANTFHMIAGDVNLSKAEKYYGDPTDVYLLQAALEDADYDYIFLDSAPERGILLYMEYAASDYIIAPTESDDGSINGLFRIENDLGVMRKYNQTHAQILGTLLTKYENTISHKVAYEQLSEEAERIGGPRFKTMIRKSIASTDAKSDRISINEYNKSNNAAIDYRALAKEIIKEIKKREGESK